jgi:hypothetical protein
MNIGVASEDQLPKCCVHTLVSESKQDLGFMAVLGRTIPIGIRIPLFWLIDASDPEYFVSIHITGVCILVAAIILVVPSAVLPH